MYPQAEAGIAQMMEVTQLKQENVQITLFLVSNERSRLPYPKQLSKNKTRFEFLFYVRFDSVN